jgi:hypothetical protein
MAAWQDGRRGWLAAPVRSPSAYLAGFVVKSEGKK